MIDLLTRISVLYNIPQWAVNCAALSIFLFLIATPFIAKKLMEPKFYKFREMMMYNVLWRWKYRKGEVSALWCFCPTCNAMLMCDDEHCRSTEELQEKITFFVCNDCGGHEQGRVVGGDRRYAQSLVKREIWRQIRSLDYIETIKKTKESKEALANAAQTMEAQTEIEEPVIAENTENNTQNNTQDTTSPESEIPKIADSETSVQPQEPVAPLEQSEPKHGV